MKVKLDQYGVKNYNDELEYNHISSLVDFDKYYEVFNSNPSGYSIITDLDSPKILFFYKHEIKEVLHD